MSPETDAGDAAKSATGGDERALLRAATRLILRWVRRVFVGLSWLWLVGMGLLVGGWQWIGESNPSLAFSMYVPPSFWLIPLLLMGPIVVLVAFRHAVGMLAAGALLLVWGWGWEWRRAAPMKGPEQRGEDELVILSNNRGQHGGHSLRPFKNTVEPDILVFQESAGTAPGYLADPGYSEFRHGVSVGEFTLLSRHPITNHSEVRESSKASGLMYAARFELDWNGRRLVIYNVHLPTPRDTLLSMRMGGFLYGLPVPTARWGQRAEHLGGFWRRQQALVEDLLRRLDNETDPVVVAGDFNVPPLGRIHRLLRSRLKDAHAAAGEGFGFTFPGETRNPLSLGGPWLRIDYIFAGSALAVSGCWSEPHRRSQHRSVAARLVKVGGS